MKRVIALLAFFASVFIRVTAMTPLDNHQIRHYTVQDGLASNAVYSIFQDSKGRMWFGTIDGLHSFDGYLMREWRDSGIKSLGSIIYCIAEDRQQRLWVGSNRSVSVFDMHQERFTELYVNPESGIRLKTPVMKVLHGSNDITWLATSGEGVFSYDNRTHILTQYPAPAKIVNDYVNDLFIDSQGNLWAMTQTGVCRYNTQYDRFVSVQTEDGKVLYASSIHEDRNHNIWIGTKNEGLYLFDQWSGRLISKLKSVADSKFFQIREIVEWEPGTILMVSDMGLTCYDTSTGEATLLQADSNARNSLNDNYLHSLFVDREGALWIGSYFGGVSYIAPHKLSFNHYNSENTNLSAKVISVFAKGDDDNIWVGTDDNGVFSWNRSTGMFTSISGHSLMRSAPHKNIHALLQTGDRLMVGMYLGGLNILNIKTGEVKNYMAGDDTNSLYASSIYSLYKDHENVIWVGTVRGLNKYRPETDDFERVFEVYPADVCFMTDDRRGFLWACTSDAGVYRMNRATGKWEHFFFDNRLGDRGRGSLPTNAVVTAECDLDGNMWFGTDGHGLLRFDYDSETFIPEKTLAAMRVVNRIISTGGDLWISSSKGLFCYNPVKKEIRSYDRNSGLYENVFQPNSGLKLPDGSVLVGSINGICEFSPSLISHERNNPEVILTDLQIFNKPVEIGVDGSGLEESITYADGLTLPYDKNMISFRGSPLSYINASQNNYLYKLEGLDKEWFEAKPPYTHSYANLPPGNYTFRVRTADGSGGWNPESLTFPITILHPWWLSTPVIILYILLFVAMVWGIYRYFINRQKENLRKLADEKDRALYQSRIEMFTHIVHEIRTPLTLILSPLESIMHTPMQMSECRNHMAIMERNGQRLLHMVNHLMDFRKLEAGGVKMHMIPVDLRMPLRSMCDDIMLSASMKHIDVNVSMPDYPCVSMIDRSAFRHVVYNLLSNALKFTTSRIDVSLALDSDGQCLRLSVKDNGPGIPAAEREKIFMPFYQIAENRQTDNVGTGLGLLLVKRFSALMEADIKLDSTLGQGTEFIVTFRSTDEHPVDIEPESESAFETKGLIVNNVMGGGKNDEISVGTEGVEQEAKKRIVVVDDNDDMLSFLRSLLSVTYDVTVFSRATEALESVRDSGPDLVISDVMMPEMDGMEFCRIMKTDIRTSHIPVVLLTAKVENNDIIDGFDSGADMYITKPFSPQVIEARIRSVLTNRAILAARLRENPAAIEQVLPEESPDKLLFEQVNEIIVLHIGDPHLSVNFIADEMKIGRTTLYDKMKKLTQMTPREYIRKMRMCCAAEMLLTKGSSVSSVSEMVGYQSRSYFIKCFFEHHGMLPGEYQELHASRQDQVV